MIDRRVKLRDIELEAVLRPGLIPERLPKLPEGTMDAFPFDAGICVGRELCHENRLQNGHDRMVNDSIREIWKTENIAFLRLINFEGRVRRRLIFQSNQSMVERI